MKITTLLFTFLLISVFSYSQCDGIVVTTSSITARACDTYTSNSGTVYTNSGTYIDTTRNVDDCITNIDTIELEIVLNEAINLTTSACMMYESETGMIYTTTGIHTEMLPGIQGCANDVTLTIDLTINSGSPAGTTFDTLSVCGQFNAPDGQVFTTSGDYMYAVQDINGCDSIIDLNLTVTANSSNSIIETSTCMAYTAPDGMVYTGSGMYTATIPNAAGCDSIISIDLTVTMPSYDTIDVVSCDTYTAADGQDFTMTGIYDVVISNAVGCDSMIHINLTINATSYDTVIVSSCGAYTAADGQILTTTGIYDISIPNALGCDSLIHLDLTVSSAPSASASQSNNTIITASPAGMFYQWIDCNTNEEISSATNQIIEPGSGSYAVIVSNAAGCADTSSCVSVTNTANINDLNKLNLSVSPNPVKDVLNINASNFVAYTIFDLTGKALVSGKELTINVTNLPKGLYLINVLGTNSNESIRFVKE